MYLQNEIKFIKGWHCNGPCAYENEFGIKVQDEHYCVCVIQIIQPTVLHYFVKVYIRWQ